MKRFVVCLIALAAFSAPASARDSYFTFHGHRIHIGDLRHCRSLSCVKASISDLGYAHRNRDADAETAPDQVSPPAPVAPPASPPPPPAQASPPPPAPAPVQTRPATAPIQAQPAPAQAPQTPSVIAQVPMMATRTPT